MRPGWIRYRRCFLQIVGEDDARDGPFRSGNTNSSVDQVPYLRWGRGHVHIFMGHVFEQREKVNFLLIIPSESSTGLLSDDRHNRLVIQFRVVEAVQKMNGAGT